MSDSTQSKDFDPDLRDIKNAEKVVEKDNVCSVKKQFLDKAPVKVQWSQNLKQREATYYEVAFTNTSLAEQPKGYLFIVDSKLDTFKQLCREENDKYIFTVTRDFLYGQKNNSGSNRFLVFHDPSTRIYQHRFVGATFQKYGNMIAGFVDNWGDASNNPVSVVMSKLTGILGNELKRFD